MKILTFILLASIPGLGGGVNQKNKEGAELYREGNLDEALTSFTQAQVESPDAPEIHYNIGNVHYRKEEMEKSVEDPHRTRRAHDCLNRLLPDALRYRRAGRPPRWTCRGLSLGAVVAVVHGCGRVGPHDLLHGAGDLPEIVLSVEQV